MVKLTAGLMVGTGTLGSELRSCLAGLPVEVVWECGVGESVNALVARVEGQRLDVLVLDVSLLPDAGKAIIRKVSALANAPCVIVVSDRLEADAVLSALRWGAAEYVSPPLAEPLRKAIERLADRASRAVTSAEPPAPRTRGRGPGGRFSLRGGGGGLEPAPIDPVQFSVTAPPKAAPRSRIMVDVWAHLASQRDDVAALAREAAAGAAVQTRSRDPIQVARGTLLTVRLDVEDATVDPEQELIAWEGAIAHASFLVATGEQRCARAAAARIYTNALEIARIRFVLDPAAAPAPSELLPVETQRHRKAFASYAHPDRDQVLARIQGIQKAAPSLEIFLDVLSLRSGQDWHAHLWEVIPQHDVFYLFWSANARKSEWVDAEWRCALASRGHDFIDPIPLCPPEEAPPPEELSGKHFNDWVLAFMRGRAARS
jgi:DNA-binding response OmpR family regulator